MQRKSLDLCRAEYSRTSPDSVLNSVSYHLEADQQPTSATRSLPLIAALLLSSAMPAFANDSECRNKLDNEKDPWTANFYLDNDLFTETDRNYTNGIRVSLVSPNVDNFLTDDCLPNWVLGVNQYLPFLDAEASTNEKVQRNLIITFGQQIYTPNDINRTTTDPDDRPYAGWLYSGLAYQSRSKNILRTTELNVGIVGPAALGQEAQDFIHDLRGFDKFQGWDNQLENELGLQLVHELKYRYAPKPLTGVLSYDTIFHAGGSLGNVATYANAGAEFRLGWHLPDDFGTSALRPGGDNSAPGPTDARYSSASRDNSIGAHLFIAADGRYVLQDIFLDGNTFSDSHSVDKEPFVGEVIVGWAVLYRGAKFSFSRVHRSREFKGQPEGHNYGAMSLSYSFEF